MWRGTCAPIRRRRRGRRRPDAGEGQVPGATSRSTKPVAQACWVVRRAGYVAWLAWLFSHILKLIGFRNRVVVFIQWAWAYVTYQRSARLITGGRP